MAERTRSASSFQRLVTIKWEHDRTWGAWDKLPRVDGVEEIRLTSLAPVWKLVVIVVVVRPHSHMDGPLCLTPTSIRSASPA